MTNRDLLARGQQFRLMSGGSGSVGELIGSGGQGAVYSADVAGRKLALKWYHPQVALADVTLRERISRMVAQGPPDQNFLWPLAFVEIQNSPSFGYIMPFMSGDRRPLKDLFVPPPNGINPTLEIRAAACFDIATSFQRLHATGYCYQDINFGGFFIDPERGTIQICDADNIAVDGEPGGVYGTRKFMAPEVVRRETLPSTKTDLYSMAVLFFYMLFNWHPLDGKREAAVPMMDHATEMKLYASDPLFMFDPKNKSNGPVDGTHDWIVARWAAMTEPVRSLFTRAFTSGLQAKGDRPLESEWRSALAQLRASTLACSACGFEHGYDLARLRDKEPCCTACSKPLGVPPVLTIAREPILLMPRRPIFDYQISGDLNAGDEPVATTESHPKDPSILGLKNLGQDIWKIRTLEGQGATVASGKTAKLADGLAINFGQREGKVSGIAEAASRMGTAA